MSGLSRRDMLKRGAGLAGMVWVAPSVNSVGLTLAQAEPTSPVSCAPSVSIDPSYQCRYFEDEGQNEFWRYRLIACSPCDCDSHHWYENGVKEFPYLEFPDSTGCSTHLVDVPYPTGAISVTVTCVQGQVESDPGAPLLLDGTGCTGPD